MPQVLELETGENCSLPEAIEALATLDFNPREVESAHEAAIWLKRLANNRIFLADLLLDRLAGRRSGEPESGFQIDFKNIRPVIIGHPHQ